MVEWFYALKCLLNKTHFSRGSLCQLTLTTVSLWLFSLIFFSRNDIQWNLFNPVTHGTDQNCPVKWSVHYNGVSGSKVSLYLFNKPFFFCMIDAASQDVVQSMIHIVYYFNITFVDEQKWVTFLRGCSQGAEWYPVEGEGCGNIFSSIFLDSVKPKYCTCNSSRVIKGTKHGYLLQYNFSLTKQ